MEIPMTRRRALKTLFCSSALLGHGPELFGQSRPAAGSLDLLALGDFGTGDERQKAVARGMARYAAGLGKKPDGVMFLGDNFYGAMPGGLTSKRWMEGYSQMYPAKDFPGPCWAIFGNHDYHDNRGGELVQLGYAKSLNRRTRWTCPAKFYRVDFPELTMLMLDTNWESINRRVHGDNRPCWMQEDEREAQLLWLEKELASERAPFTIVAGHHPIYSDANHGDTPELVATLGPLLEKHGVHAYFCGHDHDLQHMELEGLRTSFVLSGGGGARLYDSAEARAGSTVLDVHGFTHLSVRGGEMTIRHVDPNGKIVHAFTKGVNHDWKILA
ncbi:metallophosphoesterase [Luteolibacter marinus]|uniref:metallophosphoesterase n=1 Tax=Luteolibacter marinus TaxID=2776705 RepID=UPI001868A875|nr:metallophosphoesterase [Luteolibacter marinus]